VEQKVLGVLEMTIHYYCPIYQAYITATVPTELAFKLMRWA
jgi:hypothetical protein